MLISDRILNQNNKLTPSHVTVPPTNCHYAGRFDGDLRDEGVG